MSAEEITENIVVIQTITKKLGASYGQTGDYWEHRFPEDTSILAIVAFVLNDEMVATMIDNRHPLNLLSK